MIERGRSTPSRTVFITGGTGYLGAALIRQLTSRGHSVRALTRQASVDRLPSGSMPVIGDALHGLSYAHRSRRRIPSCTWSVSRIRARPRRSNS